MIKNLQQWVNDMDAHRTPFEITQYIIQNVVFSDAKGEISSISKERITTSSYNGRKIEILSSDFSLDNLHHLSEIERLQHIIHGFRKGQFVVLESSGSEHIRKIIGSSEARRKISDFPLSSFIPKAVAPQQQSDRGLNAADSLLSTSINVEVDRLLADFEEVSEDEIDAVEQIVETKINDKLEKKKAESNIQESEIRQSSYFSQLHIHNSEQTKKLKKPLIVENIALLAEIAATRLIQIKKMTQENLTRAAQEEKERYEEDSKKLENSSRIKKEEVKKQSEKQEAIKRDIKTKNQL